jgi:hypothetical protein
MANVQIVNSITNTIAAKRTRYEKMEVAYGKIPSTAWADGDTLVLDQIPMLQLIHAKFVSDAGTTTELELFHGADLTNAIAWNISNSNTTTNISYVVSYIRGTGKVQDTEATAGEGKLIRLTVAV